MVVVSRKMQAVCLALLCCQPRAVSLSVVTWHLRDLFKSIFIGFCANSIFTPAKELCRYCLCFLFLDLFLSALTTNEFWAGSL